MNPTAPPRGSSQNFTPNLPNSYNYVPSGHGPPNPYLYHPNFIPPPQQNYQPSLLPQSQNYNSPPMLYRPAQPYMSQTMASPVIQPVPPIRQINSNLPSTRSQNNSKSTVGIQNRTGENNCFLNSVIQLLWHIESFKSEIYLITQTSPTGLELQKLFKQLSNQSSLISTSNLRQILGYQKDSMDDAVEAIQKILSNIHQKTFGHEIIEQVSCQGCGKPTNNHTYSENILYVQGNSFLQTLKLNYSQNFNNNLATCLKLASCTTYGDESKVTPCPINQNICPGSKQPLKNRKCLKNTPSTLILCLQFINQPNLSQIQQLYQAISGQNLKLDLQDLYHSVQSNTFVQEAQLTGLVCYYGLHFTTIVYHHVRKVWCFIDDTKVKDIGCDFSKVIEYCVNNTFRPYILIYDRKNSDEISEAEILSNLKATGQGMPGSYSGQITNSTTNPAKSNQPMAAPIRTSSNLHYPITRTFNPVSHSLLNQNLPKASLPQPKQKVQIAANFVPPQQPKASPILPSSQSSNQMLQKEKRYPSINLLGEEEDAVTPFNAHIRHLYQQAQNYKK